MFSVGGQEFTEIFHDSWLQFNNCLNLKKENTENPCFGGNEWLGFNHRQWGEQNCNADWETTFPDPGSVSGKSSYFRLWIVIGFYMLTRG